MSLRSQVIIVVIALMGASIGFIQYIALTDYRDQYKRLLLDEGHIAARELNLKIQHLRALGLQLNEFYNFGPVLDQIVEGEDKFQHVFITDLQGQTLFQDSHYPHSNEKTQPLENILGSHVHIVFPIKGEDERRLGEIIILINDGLIDAEVTRLVKNALITSALTLIVGISALLWLLWYRLGRPTAKLLEHIHTTELETYAHQPSDLSLRNDELGLITRTFDGLMSRLADAKRKLSEHASNMEQQVQEKTSELTIANMALHEDIQRRLELEHRLKQAANTDALTGLPNRLFFMDLLERRFDRAKRRNQPLALMLMDFDGFKIINDLYGHPEGDHALTSIALRMQNALRVSDTFARLGGDEFVLLVEGYDSHENLERMAQKLSALASEPIHHDGREYNLGVSIGIAEMSPAFTSSKSLMKAADQAMYYAKNHDLKYWFHHVKPEETESNVYRL